jgi:putative hydrolase of the HAD superfamily
MPTVPITHVFTDIGGVLATNGWDRPLRKRTAEKFGVNVDEMNERHHLTYDTYESGKMDLHTYLDRVMFWEPRPFTHQDVIHYIIHEARPHPEMLQLLRDLKAKHGIKIGVVSNEGRELAADRIQRFRLFEFVDFFIVSSFVHFRKPDEDIWRIALDTAQAPPEQVAYIEDRQMFVEVSARLGIKSIWHRSAEKTRAELAHLGLAL